MKRKRAIKRFFLTLMWLGVAAGMVTVVTAAMRVQDAGTCKGYSIRIDGFNEDQLFTSKDQIFALLKTATKGNVKGQRKSEFNLPQIEDLLEQSSWVYNADLYFDNQDILHANVVERKPLARVFDNKGASFYIDEAGKQIPLSEKISLDLPVFTGYPQKKVMTKSDSILVQNIIATASFISGDPFWTSQVAQINIINCGADCWNMEMIPVVGNHKVELGDGSDIASRFHRLYLFYDQVLKRTGFDKYQKIDVQYNGQVIGVRGNYNKIDSLQLRKNIEHLLMQSREYNNMVLSAPAVDYLEALQRDSLANAASLNTSDDLFEDSILQQEVKPVPEHEVLEEVANDVKKEKVSADNSVHTKAKVSKSVERMPVARENEKKVTKVVSTKAADKKATQPKLVSKPASISKKVSDKKTVVKKAENAKPAAKSTVSKTVTKKPEVKKPVVKKEVPKKDVKRNLLVKPQATN